MAGIYDVKIGRLRIPTVEGEIVETVGGSVEASGRSVLAGERSPRGINLVLPIYGSAGDGEDAYELGMRKRRQVRALFANDGARMQALYFRLTPDPELNGWIVCAGADVAYKNGGPSLGEFELRLRDAYLVGQIHTERQAYAANWANRRLQTTPRDTL